MHNLLNIGFGNIIVSARIVSVVSAGSSPIKRLRETAKDGNNLIDATEGRKTKTIIVTDSGHIILSALNAATIITRLEESLSKEKNTAI
ncbi:MAG: DUF370 domain-containing protein [Candidatus Acididesulfobacter diazotrophicus]|jgi:regulator of extracellular matrix RemA (YlzA/DUF370 family)|uniref:Putative regulatory protein EVG15_04630 n=1 Tax=Candidatus Acididesulfobacter diazotrophicus TaxID=2597226 RepID=A0A519BN27_9DELT|nr:MAG: DUF370 domain-containing protein [Candidatus Acididesulfobacter diazotrophicus]